MVETETDIKALARHILLFLVLQHFAIFISYHYPVIINDECEC